MPTWMVFGILTFAILLIACAWLAFTRRPALGAVGAALLAAFCRNGKAKCFEPSHKFFGAGISLWITLRQVTASADLLHIHKQRKGGPVDGLTGYQPIMRMSYASPLFTF